MTLRLRQPTVTDVRMTPTAGGRSGLVVIAKVRPVPGGGRLVLELQRFDPLSGWQFVASSGHIAHGGTTSFSLRPALGSWQVRVRYGGTLSDSASDSGWIAFTVDAGASTGQAKGGACTPGATAGFAVGGMRISCGGGSFGEKPTTAAQTPGAALRTLRSAVSGIATLKDPFKSDMLDTIDAAIDAFTANNLDECRAQLDQFVTELRAAPVQAQLTAAQRNQFIKSAKQIEAQLG